MEQTNTAETVEAFHELYLRKSVSTYLEGQNDWKWVVTTVSRSGFSKREARQILAPLKGHGWLFRRRALFEWLEQA